MGKRYRDLIRQYSTARGGCRSVLNVLADYADDNGVAYPGIARLAEDCGLSDRQVQRNLARLVDFGQIEIIAGHQGGRGIVTRYRLLVPEKGDILSSFKPQKGDILSTERVTSWQEKGDILAEKGDILSNRTIYIEPYEPIEEPEGEPRERAPAREAPEPEGLKQPTLVPSNHPALKQRRHNSKYLDGRRFVNGYIPPGCARNAVEVYYERFSVNTDLALLTTIQEKDLIDHCPDLARLRAVVIAYSQTNYRPGNVGLMLDWYRDGVPKHERNDKQAQTKADRTAEAFANVERMLQEQGITL